MIVCRHYHSTTPSHHVRSPLKRDSRASDLCSTCVQTSALEIFLKYLPASKKCSSLKIGLFLLSFLIFYQVSCHFAAVETDAKNVTGRIVAWNNRTSSEYSDVSDQVFSGCFVRRLLNKITSV